MLSLTCNPCSKMPSSLTCHPCSEILPLLLSLMLSISKSFINANQVAKLVYQFISLINACLNLVVKYKEKVYAYHTTEKTVSKVLRDGWLDLADLFLKHYHQSLIYLLSEISP